MDIFCLFNRCVNSNRTFLIFLKTEQERLQVLCLQEKILGCVVVVMHPSYKADYFNNPVFKIKDLILPLTDKQVEALPPFRHRHASLDQNFLLPKRGFIGFDVVVSNINFKSVRPVQVCGLKECGGCHQLDKKCWSSAGQSKASAIIGLCANIEVT